MIEELVALVLAWEHRAEIEGPMGSGTLMCATDLKNILRKYGHSTTEPGPPPSGTEETPSMRWPSCMPTMVGTPEPEE